MDSFVHENIDGTNGRYRWTRYLNIRVIEDTTNGYINATKMCAMYGKTKGGKVKQFYQWKLYNKQFINITGHNLNMKTEDIIKEAVTGGQVEIVRGTYVHPDIVTGIASWCGIDINDNVVLQNYQKVLNDVKRQYIPKSGYVYVMTAPMFSFYGKNVYKIGYTENLRKRMQGFISIPGLGYLYTKAVASIDVEQKVHSILCPFILFNDHELFDVPLDLIKESINIAENVKLCNIRQNIEVPRDNKMHRFDSFMSKN